MKPLKEIGTVMYEHPFEGRGALLSIVPQQGFPDDYTPSAPYTVLSLEERRQLVREVWEAVVNSSGWIREVDGIQLDVEEFIKSEGL
jgi:hypothetical protein